MPIVYALTNAAFEQFVKIGTTSNLEQRLKQLDNTSVPLPFRCVYAIDVHNADEVERLVHEAFADHRVRRGREFFQVEPQRIIAALKLTGGQNVTPRQDIAADDDGLEALHRVRQPKQRFSFEDAGLTTGNLVYFANDHSITAEVVDDNRILFEGEQISLSKSALILLNREGYGWQTVNGWSYWMFDGETLAERRDRLLAEQACDKAADMLD